MPAACPRTLGELQEDGARYICTSCRSCGREGTYLVKRLMSAYGNLDLPRLLQGLSFGCQKRVASMPDDPCKNDFVGLK
jgi:hypothetical protein